MTHPELASSTGSAGTPLGSMRASYDALATAAPPSTKVGPEPGPLASGGPTVSTLIFGGSIILLIGGVALLVLGSRRREPIPGN